MIVINS